MQIKMYNTSQEMQEPSADKSKVEHKNQATCFSRSQDKHLPIRMPDIQSDFFQYLLFLPTISQSLVNENNRLEAEENRSA